MEEEPVKETEETQEEVLQTIEAQIEENVEEPSTAITATTENKENEDQVGDKDSVASDVSAEPPAQDTKDNEDNDDIIHFDEETKKLPPPEFGETGETDETQGEKDETQGEKDEMDEMDETDEIEKKAEKEERKSAEMEIFTYTQTQSLNVDAVRQAIAEPMLSLGDIFGTENVFDIGPIIKLTSESNIEEEEEDEQIDYLVELGLQPPEKEPINREYYEDLYKKARVDRAKLRRKNMFLYKKLSEYYKKRKMYRVFDEINPDVFESVLDKYEQKLDDYYEFQIKTEREKEAIESELHDMMALRDEQNVELEQSFTLMMTREKEIGHGLIDTTTGKFISDKVIERFINRQKVKSNEIAEIRLMYIKRRDKVREIENKLKALETIGGTLHLIDFEQLRMENQSFSDKIEERDEELMRLRDRYFNAMQALAHLREKINVIEEQIDTLEEKKASKEQAVSKLRESLNAFKIERDSNRAVTDKLKAMSGILIYPKLIKDMESSMIETEELRETLEKLISDNMQNRIKLAAIRHTIEKTEPVVSKRMQIKKKGNSVCRYYLHRPTIAIPVFPKKKRSSTRVHK